MPSTNGRASVAVSFRLSVDGRPLETFDDMTVALFRAKRKAKHMREHARNVAERDKFQGYIDHSDRVWNLFFGITTLKGTSK